MPVQPHFLTWSIVDGLPVLVQVHRLLHVVRGRGLLALWLPIGPGRGDGVRQRVEAVVQDGAGAVAQQGVEVGRVLVAVALRVGEHAAVLLARHVVASRVQQRHRSVARLVLARLTVGREEVGGSRIVVGVVVGGMVLGEHGCLGLARLGGLGRQVLRRLGDVQRALERLGGLVDSRVLVVGGRAAGSGIGGGQSALA